MGEELPVIRLRNDFYRDGFTKVLLALGMIFAAIILLVATSIYLYVAKPPPVTFSTDNEWRLVAPVPLDQPYLNVGDLTQWVSEVVPNLFNYDFLHYMANVKKNQQYFTPEGFKKYSALLNQYVSYNLVNTTKLFVTSAPDGAPVIINQGKLNGRYSWWVQMPVVIHYGSLDRGVTQNITFQLLVVRESTLNNLSGVVIDNMLVPQAIPKATEPAPAEAQPITLEGQVGANG